MLRAPPELKTKYLYEALLTHQATHRAPREKTRSLPSPVRICGDMGMQTLEAASDAITTPSRTTTARRPKPEQTSGRNLPETTFGHPANTTHPMAPDMSGAVR